MFLKISRNFKKTFLVFLFPFFIFAIAGIALAQTPTPGPADYVPLVNIPGIPAGAKLTDYLSGLYNFLISVVGILAMGVMIYGGMRYLTSAGNPAAAEDAKDAITSAIYGLVLALASWLIINVVNPDILVLKKPGVGLPGGVYSYGATSNSCVTSPNGNGTKENPCQCIDGAKVTVSKKVANLTLNASPSSVVFGGTITATGKLTDASTGAGLGGKTIRLRVVNPDPMINMWAESPTFTTNADGTFSYPVVENICTAKEKWQITFVGDPTYADTGSNIVDVETTPPGGSPCDTTNYTNSPAAFLSVGDGTFCNQVCSDKTLAAEKMNPDGSWVADGTYHCLKAEVRIGWVSDPSVYSDEQLRAMATNIGTDATPFVATEGAWYIIEMEKYSTVLNKPAIYRMDTNYDGVCDGSDTILSGTGGGWDKVKALYIDPPPVICKLSSTPKATNCSQKLCIEDSRGNKAQTTLYSTILAK